ncbi:uncharacterized protein LOC113852243 [Abrus precatorius]|uniref:Uncharacterized protein LOC113852243 n=1 Tax=Abrus precatorius TaxID=3816 RepID=A0A8B8K3D3_ABRPR|nr:uncharacterized protein LOC113852243 [Abrus precatorius]
MVTIPQCHPILKDNSATFSFPHRLNLPPQSHITNLQKTQTMKPNNKIQIPFITHSLFSIILVCFALGKCTAHDTKNALLPNEAFPPQFSDSELPFPFPPSETPNSNPTSEEGFAHSPSSFSSAFSDILKGTVLRGNSLVMPEQVNSEESQTKTKMIKYQAVKQICSHTDYPDVCLSTITPFLNDHFDVMNVLEASIKACGHQIRFTISKVKKYFGSSPELDSLLTDCRNQYSDAMENLQRAMDAIPSRDLGTVTVMLSAVMADVSTCESGFEDLKSTSPVANSEGLVTITASNCLAIASLIPY